MVIIIVGSILFVVVLCTLLFAFKKKTSSKELPLLSDFPFEYNCRESNAVYFSLGNFNVGGVLHNDVRPDGKYGLGIITFKGVNDHKQSEWECLLKDGDDVFELVTKFRDLKKALEQRKIKVEMGYGFEKSWKSLESKIDNLPMQVH